MGCISSNLGGFNEQVIISGMGELHLDIYVERIRREYKVPSFSSIELRINYPTAVQLKNSLQNIFSYLPNYKPYSFALS